MKNMKFLMTIIFLGLMAGVIASLAPRIGSDGMEPPKVNPMSLAHRANHLKEMEEMRKLGARHIEEGRYPQAIGLFLNLNSMNHYDQRPYVQLARVVKKAGPEKFERMVREKIKTKPNANDIDKVLGGAYYHADRLDLAGEHIENHLKTNPNDLAALYFRGVMAVHSGAMEEGIHLLESIIKKEPTHYYSLVELGEAYRATGQTKLADKMAALAKKYDPSLNKGICCKTLGKAG